MFVYFICSFVSCVPFIVICYLCLYVVLFQLWAIWLLTYQVNPLNAELNPICHLLALLGAHHIFHVSGLRVNKQELN